MSPPKSFRLAPPVLLAIVTLPLILGGPRAFAATPIPRATIADGTGADRVGLDEFRRTAREAYVWGWALVYLHQCRLALERVPAPGRCGGIPVAPVNRLAMLTDIIRPRTTVVPCANQDVIYGFGMFDLAADAVVIQIPDFGDRFWLYQLGDHRTDAFARVGRMHGTQPGCYLVVGPDWNGKIPAGIAGVFRCPTRYGYCLPRVHVDGTEEDRLSALPAVNQIVAYPLAEFDGSPRTHDWSRSRWLPNLASRGRHQGGVSPEAFFEVLPEVLAAVPALPGEEALYARFHGLIRAIENRPEMMAHAVEAARDADRDIVEPLFHFRNVGRPLPGYWTTVDNGASFGGDYLTRTAVAKSNVFVNTAQEARYYYLDLDALGERLEGGEHYRLTFPAGALPPARAFWSVTIYDERHALPEGDGPHAIGSHSAGVEFAEDGSLSILVGPALAGGADRASPNRLVTPTGSFSLYLRIYWPEDTVLDGSWTPPPVRRDGTIAAADRPVSRTAVLGSVAAPAPEERPSAAAAKASGVAMVPPSRAGGAKGRRGRFVRSSDREVVRRR
ncbi:MAG: DUF1254 domain-containing protein [Planctomycetia bacterium]